MRDLTRMARRLIEGAVVAAMGLVVGGCGAERSPQAYCDAFWDKAIPFREQLTKSNENLDNDPFTGIMNLLSPPRDLAGIFDSMAKAAPEEIRTDTEAVRDAFNKLADSYGETVKNPFGALASNLGTALLTGAAMNRVDAYLTEHCGTPEEAIAERS